MIIIIPPRDARCAQPTYAFPRAEEALLCDSRQPKLIDGDLQLTNWAILSSPSANPATSFIFAHDVELPEEFHVECFRKLKAALLPGIEDEDTAFCAVLHREGMRRNPPLPRHACHAYIANRHLSTSVQLQPYYHQADRLILELFQEITNIENGLASPKDAFRGREQNYLPSWIKGDRRQLEADLQADAEVASAFGFFADRESATYYWRSLKFDGVEFGRCRSGLPYVKLFIGETDRPIILKGAIYGIENQPDSEADRRSELFGPGGLERTPERAQLLRGELDKEIERKRRYLDRVLKPARARVIAAPALGWGDFVHGGAGGSVSGHVSSEPVRPEGIGGEAGDVRHQVLRGATPAAGGKIGETGATGDGGTEQAQQAAGHRGDNGNRAQPVERADQAPRDFAFAPVPRPSHRPTLPVHGMAAGSAPDACREHLGRGPDSPLGLTIASTTQKEKHDLEPGTQNSYFASAESQRAGDPDRLPASGNRPDKIAPDGGDRSLPALAQAVFNTAGNALESAGKLGGAFDELELNIGRLDRAISRVFSAEEVTETLPVPARPWGEDLNVISPDLSAPTVAEKSPRVGVGRLGRDRFTIINDLPDLAVGE